MISCQRCGTEGPDGFRFCGSCGAELHASDEPRESRKVVTALFCDVADSTALGEALDPEVLRHVINRYFADMRKAIERHGGTVEKFIGDAVMAVFGIPRVREDDALRAVRAAVEIRERLPILAEEVGVSLRVRTGINTGLVLMSGGENLAIGLVLAGHPEAARHIDRDMVARRHMDVVEQPVQLQRRLDLDAGFLGHLADQRMLAGFARLDAAAGKMPAGRIAVLDQQHAALLVERDAAHAERHRAHQHETHVRDTVAPAFAPPSRRCFVRAHGALARLVAIRPRRQRRIRVAVETGPRWVLKLRIFLTRI